MECPLKSNGDTRIFVWHSHKENGDAHVWHSHKDKGDDTQGLCVTFTLRKVRHFHTEKDFKKAWQSTQNNGDVWNKGKQ